MSTTIHLTYLPRGAHRYRSAVREACAPLPARTNACGAELTLADLPPRDFRACARDDQWRSRLCPDCVRLAESAPAPKPRARLRRVTPVLVAAESAVIQHAPIAHVRYTREPHGVHLAGSHEPRDVEHWSVAQAPGTPHHPAVPRDATYVSSLPVDGVSYALYVRWAPASACPNCPTCAARAARRPR
jgi:hypothetical protein